MNNKNTLNYKLFWGEFSPIPFLSFSLIFFSTDKLLYLTMLYSEKA